MLYSELKKHLFEFFFFLGTGTYFNLQLSSCTDPLVPSECCGVKVQSHELNLSEILKS